MFCGNLFLLIVLLVASTVVVDAFFPPIFKKGFRKVWEHSEPSEITPEQINSPEIKRLQSRIAELEQNIENVKQQIVVDEQEFEKLDAEYGSEIARVKKEFARIKERSYEEATEAANKAKVDALKEVLPITDNYFRAKQLFEPAETDNEKLIMKTYDEVFSSFNSVIEGFGVKRVESLGQPFDYNMMEAIMTVPSTEYAKDIVCTEYQVGYAMGDKCIRPAMVVVSLGPGPSA